MKFPPVHDDLTFLAPLSEERGTRLEASLADHEPDRPDAPEVRQLIARQHAGYFGGYRGVLGLAYLHLVAV